MGPGRVMRRVVGHYRTTAAAVGYLLRSTLLIYGREIIGSCLIEKSKYCEPASSAVNNFKYALARPNMIVWGETLGSQLSNSGFGLKIRQ